MQRAGIPASTSCGGDDVAGSERLEDVGVDADGESVLPDRRVRVEGTHEYHQCRKSGAERGNSIETVLYGCFEIHDHQIGAALFDGGHACASSPASPSTDVAISEC